MTLTRRKTTAIASIPVLLCLLAGCSGSSSSEAPGGVGPAATPAKNERPAPLGDWPPRPGETWPDHVFHDADGNAVRMSDFRGKVLLIEPIGMNCPACNAFAGANRPGMSGYRRTTPQSGLLSLEEMLPAYANGATVDHPDLVVVHLLLYSMRMGATTAADARGWAKHFGVDRPNHVVLHADERFINQASYDMIPGFQLVDRNLVLRSDSTGHHPRDDLYRKLLPMLGDMLGR